MLLGPYLTSDAVIQTPTSHPVTSVSLHPLTGSSPTRTPPRALPRPVAVSGILQTPRPPGTVSPSLSSICNSHWVEVLGRLRHIWKAARPKLTHRYTPSPACSRRAHSRWWCGIGAGSLVPVLGSSLLVTSTSSALSLLRLDPLRPIIPPASPRHHLSSGLAHLGKCHHLDFWSLVSEPVPTPGLRAVSPGRWPHHISAPFKTYPVASCSQTLQCDLIWSLII